MFPEGSVGNTVHSHQEKKNPRVVTVTVGGTVEVESVGSNHGVSVGTPQTVGVGGGEFGDGRGPVRNRRKVVQKGNQFDHVDPNLNIKSGWFHPENRVTNRRLEVLESENPLSTGDT